MEDKKARPDDKPSPKPLTTSRDMEAHLRTIQSLWEGTKVYRVGVLMGIASQEASVLCLLLFYSLSRL